MSLLLPRTTLMAATLCLRATGHGWPSEALYQIPQSHRTVPGMGLRQSSQMVTIPSNMNLIEDEYKGYSTGALAGGIVGSAIGGVLIGVLIFWLLTRHR
jgi:hypothetical protein